MCIMYQSYLMFSFKANTSSDVKIEERSSNLAHHSLISSESGAMHGVQMFFIKAEDHLTTNEMFQALQPIHHRVACQGQFKINYLTE